METKKYLIKEINGKFHIIKDGNKRATKIFTTMIDAGDWVIDQGAELVVEQTGCGCEDCQCGKFTEQTVTQSENNNELEKTGVTYGWDSPMMTFGSYASVPKPTFKEKIKGLFNRLFK